MTRIELGVDLGMSEVLNVYSTIPQYDAKLLRIHIDELNRDLDVHSSQIHPDSDVFEAGDVGHLVVMRRFAEIKRLL